MTVPDLFCLTPPKKKKKRKTSSSSNTEKKMVLNTWKIDTLQAKPETMEQKRFCFATLPLHLLVEV